MSSTAQSRKNLARSLARDYAIDPKRTLAELTEGLAMGRRGEPGGLKSDEFGIRDLACELVRSTGGEYIGHRWVHEACDPSDGGGRLLLEASDGVDSTAFSNITGQLLINEVLTGYESPDFVFSRLIPTRPSKLLGSERLPGLTNISSDDGDLVTKEGMPTQTVGFGENYIETPATTKRSLIVAVTREAIFADLTGRVLEQANKVGYRLGLSKEKRLIRVVYGIDNNHKWRGTSYNTYQSTTPWVNLKTGNELVNWTDIEEVELLFADMVDPDTGDAIEMNPRHLIVQPFKKHTAKMILNATEVRKGDGASQTAVTIGANPITSGDYEIVSSRQAYLDLVASGVSASDAKNYWYVGDLAKAFRYIENWPITVVQAPANSEAEFNQDIVLRVKASERGVAAVMEPRAMVKVTA